jgi:hypothetical protein
MNPTLGNQEPVGNLRCAALGRPYVLPSTAFVIAERLSRNGRKERHAAFLRDLPGNGWGGPGPVIPVQRQSGMRAES